MPTPSLSLRDVRTTHVDVPLTRPLVTSAQVIWSVPLLLIDVLTEEEVIGHSYLFCYMRAAAAPIANVVRDAFETLRGDRVAPLELAAKLSRAYRLLGRTGLVGMALAGLDVAFWDALAVAAGLPLAEFLGGSACPIAAYNSNGLGLIEPECAADEAESLLDRGFQAVKMRLGRSDPRADLAAVRAVRSRLPDSISLMADYNQALPVTEAILRGEGLDGEGLSWIEEPTRHDDYRGCARIAAALKTPIQLGENFAGPHAMAAALDAGASDCVMVDLERIGGVTGWLRAAALADERGVEMSSHLFPEVSAHLLAITPTRHWLEHVDWAAPILREPLRIEGGQAIVPDRPGVGLAWDEDAIERFRVA